MPSPRPDAFSVGSSDATTTRLMPAARIASVHGGVLPVWQQGSSVTYSVAPIGSTLHGRAPRPRRGPAVGGVIALAEHLAVAYDDRADERVRARVAAPELGELDRPFHMTQVLVGQVNL